jgi:16S rRNA (cytidine1402-2'-O)-methyltransferase
LKISLEISEMMDMMDFKMIVTSLFRAHQYRVTASFHRKFSFAEVASNSSEGYNIPQGLWVVATPIGNLGDLSARAKYALLKADYILCEDTRRTAKLLYAIERQHFRDRLYRCDQFVDKNKIDKWVQQMKLGNNFALVTDAGTPSISDPGAEVVGNCVKAGIRVTPIPGPSSLSTLLSVCDFNETSFYFGGFFPRKEKDRVQAIKNISNCDFLRVGLWFEAPTRILSTIELIASEAPSCKIVLAKELTKLHEKIFHGDPLEILSALRDEITQAGEIGEWSLAVRFPPAAFSPPNKSEWLKALGLLLSAKLPISEASKQISNSYEGVSKKEVYEAALVLQKKKAEPT